MEKNKILIIGIIGVVLVGVLILINQGILASALKEEQSPVRTSSQQPQTSSGPAAAQPASQELLQEAVPVNLKTSTKSKTPKKPEPAKSTSAKDVILVQ